MPKAKYTDIKSERDEARDDASGADTEVGMPLIDEEGRRWSDRFEEVELRTQGRKVRGLRRAWNACQPFRWMVDTGLLLVIIFLLLRKPDSSMARESTGRDIGGDVTGFSPKFNKEIKTFSFNTDYVPEDPKDFFRYNVQKAWLDLVPTGLGFLKIKDAEKFNDLPTPLPEYNGTTVYTTSMTHQLHCLYSIVDNYLRLKLDYNFEDEDWHVQHCFDYLRQTIMCTADVALEGAETTFPDGMRGGSDGWDAKHVCRKYDEVFDYLEYHRVDDNKWI